MSTQSLETIGDGEIDKVFLVIIFVGCKRFERNSFFIKKILAESGRKEKKILLRALRGAIRKLKWGVK